MLPATLNHHKSALFAWNGVKLLICPFVHMYQCSSYWMDWCEIWYWRLLWKSFEKFQIWLKLGTLHEHLNMLHCCQQHLDLHKSAVFEWIGIRLLGWLRRYKHYANRPRYVTHILPVLFEWNGGTVPAVMKYVNIPKHKRWRRKSIMYPQKKKKHSLMGHSFGILFTLFTQMEDDPTIKRTPLHNTYTEPVLLCAWF